jgi:hypothetical protein
MFGVHAARWAAHARTFVHPSAMAVLPVYNAFPAATSLLALSFVPFCRALPSGKQSILASALVAAVLTAVLAKLSRLVASALVGPLIAESVKYALTDFLSSADELAEHEPPAGSPAWTTRRLAPLTLESRENALAWPLMASNISERRLCFCEVAEGFVTPPALMMASIAVQAPL